MAPGDARLDLARGVRLKGHDAPEARPRAQGAAMLPVSLGIREETRYPMDKFTVLTGVAAPLNMINVDTDMIIPKNYLKTIKRTGLGRNLFAEMRYDEQGREKAEFVLNQPAFRKATILVSGNNFGCGSSREHAPWALLDFGIKCVVAPSFADIFFNNTFKNGILPVILPEARVNEILRFLLELPGAEMTIDLPGQTVKGPDGKVDKFEVDSFRKHCLINGLDDVGLTLQKDAAIKAYETRIKGDRPWV
jgi:3-isopropylmalate/(R)-2-methylmalate dehydratase small subunit